MCDAWVLLGFCVLVCGLPILALQLGKKLGKEDAEWQANFMWTGFLLDLHLWLRHRQQVYPNAPIPEDWMSQIAQGQFPFPVEDYLCLTDRALKEYPCEHLVYHCYYSWMQSQFPKDFTPKRPRSK